MNGTSEKTPSQNGIVISRIFCDKSLAERVPTRGTPTVVMLRSFGGFKIFFGGAMKVFSCVRASAFLFVCLLLLQPVAEAASPVVQVPAYRIEQMRIVGAISRDAATYDVDYELEVLDLKRDEIILGGDVMLLSHNITAQQGSIYFDQKNGVYRFHPRKKRKIAIKLKFMARTQRSDTWRENQFQLMISERRKLNIVFNQAEVDFKLSNAIRSVKENIVGGEQAGQQVRVEALLGLGANYCFKWNSRADDLTAGLVLASDAHSIVTLGTGTLYLDALFNLSVMQGAMQKIELALSAGLTVAQVKGAYIRDWHVVEGASGRILTVVLNHEVKKRYQLQILAERAIGAMPTQLALPTIRPITDIQGSGFLAVGTDSALHLRVKNLRGITQINADEFPRWQLNGVLKKKSRKQTAHRRQLPNNKLFCFQHATDTYAMNLALDHVVPILDVQSRGIITMSEEDIIYTTSIELDVRDAPLRELRLRMPSAWTLSSVRGQAVKEEDFQVLSHGNHQESILSPTEKLVVIHFSKPIKGRSLLEVTIERGKSPLGEKVTLAGVNVLHARTQRGTIAVKAEEGITLVASSLESLREMNVGDLTQRVINARLAFRHRESQWHMNLLTKRKKIDIRAEAFNLISIADGMAYGNVTFSYTISGAPEDHLYFRIPERFKHIEFVGRDVRRWQRVKDGGEKSTTAKGVLWELSLQRKIVGDYNVGLFYTMAYEAGVPLNVGGIICERVTAQRGYMALSSHLNLAVSDSLSKADKQVSIRVIKREDIPSHYNLLINSPVLTAYKYVDLPFELSVTLSSYERGAPLPMVVEMMSLSSALSMQDDGQAESVTTVQYKIKNATQQFLKLYLPNAARVWSVKRMDEQGSSPLHVAKGKNGLLMVPLPRLRNPNQPITIVVKYGQVHGELGWQGKLSLQAPRSESSAMYAKWQVKAPVDWGLVAGQEGMNVSLKKNQLNRLDGILKESAARWASLFAKRSRDIGYVIVGISAVIIGLVLLVLYFIRRHLIRPVLFWGVGLALLAMGIGAYGMSSPTAWTGSGTEQGLAFSRALALASNGSAMVDFFILPAWRLHVQWGWGIALPVIVFLGLYVGRNNALCRRFSLPLAVTSVLLILSQFSLFSEVLLSFFTWGLPMIILLSLQKIIRLPFVCASWQARSVRKALMLMMMIFSTMNMGLSQAQAFWWSSPKAMPETAIQSLNTNISVDDKTLTVGMDMVITAQQPMVINLLPANSIVEKQVLGAGKKSIKLQVFKGWHQLNIKRKGKYTVKLTFLSPLPKRDERGQRGLEWQSPLAMKHHVVFTAHKVGVEVLMPNALHMKTKESEMLTEASGDFAPGESLKLTWRPRLRVVSREKTKFFSTLYSRCHIESGQALLENRLKLTVAQGEINTLRCKLPSGQSVIGVMGECLSTWRYQAQKRELTIKFTRPISGDYHCIIKTQMEIPDLPQNLTFGGMEILSAQRQRQALGVVGVDSVALFQGKVKGSDKLYQVLGVEDFWRQWIAFPRKEKNHVSQVDAAMPQFAFSLNEHGTLAINVERVMSQQRVREQSLFAISDERLVFNGQIQLDIAKAGLFFTRFSFPASYDLDVLRAPEISHWDELRDHDNTEENNQKRVWVKVHFKKKLLGKVNMNIVLSRSLSVLPESLDVPNIIIENSLKHTGNLIVTAQRDMRMRVIHRQYVSEVSAAKIAHAQRQGNDAKQQVFRLLQKGWQLRFKPETLSARRNVDVLHVLRVNDNITQHNHYFRAQFHHAGIKYFSVELPIDALGVKITGPSISRITEDKVVAGSINTVKRYRVALQRKWFDRVYPLRVYYERKQILGEAVEALPARWVDVDVQRGTVAFIGSNHVELVPQAGTEHLPLVDARSIDRQFSAGDLSTATFCYSVPSMDYHIKLASRYHERAAVLDAQITKASLTTIATEAGETMTRMDLSLQVGSARVLKTLLPPGAVAWTLTVNQQATDLSLASQKQGGALLIPLAQAHAGISQVQVSLLYIMPSHDSWRATKQSYQGPQFDLPVNNLTWRFYLPEDFDYEDFEGTLNLDESIFQRAATTQYDLQTYETVVSSTLRVNREKALGFQRSSIRLAKKGNQLEAKVALNNAFNYSFADQALNEDTRVELHNLIRQQAVVGLIGRRHHLKESYANTGNLKSSLDLGSQFSQEEADRVQNSLNKKDSENLELICNRLIQMQETAAGERAQLSVNLPKRGRIVELTRSIQVNAKTPMVVNFHAHRKKSSISSSLVYAAALVLIFSLLGSIVKYARREVVAHEPLVMQDSVNKNMAEEDSYDEAAIEGLIAEDDKDENGDKQADV